MTKDQFGKYKLYVDAVYLFELDSTIPSTIIVGYYSGIESSEDYIVVRQKNPGYSTKFRIERRNIISVTKSVYVDIDK